MGKGRPEGSKTTKETGTVELSRCKQCDSTERAPYTNRQELDFGGINAAGEPFTHVIWQTTYCLACGQRRRDKTYENRVSDAETQK